MNLLFSLIFCGIVGTIVFGILFLLRPITEKIFSKAWHYYSLFMPLFFLLGGTLIAVGLIGYVQQFVPESIYVQPAAYSEIAPQSSFDSPIDPVFNYPSFWNYASEGLIIPYQSDNLRISENIFRFVGRIAPFLIIIWAVGALLFLYINFTKYSKYRRLVLQQAKIHDESNCPIPIVVSTLAHTPMLMGLIKPIVVLPGIHFEDAELDIILAHELVHYKRKDLLFKITGLIANAVHWYNPAVYFLNKQINIFCELSCDEKVAYGMDAGNRKFYGETILQVLQHSTAQRSLSANLMFATNLYSSKKNIQRRLINVMNIKKMKKSTTAFAFAIVALVAGGGFTISYLADSGIPVYASVDMYHTEDEPVALRGITEMFLELEEWGIEFVDGWVEMNESGYIEWTYPTRELYHGEQIGRFHDDGLGLFFDQDRGNISVRVNRDENLYIIGVDVMPISTAPQAEETDNTPLVTIRPRPIIDRTMSNDERVYYLVREHDEFMAEIARLIPAHLRDMWDADDAEVQSLRDQNYVGGISPDDFPSYAFWFRAAMLSEIARVADLEAFHFELSRHELYVWVTIARFIDRLSWLDGEDVHLHISYFEWVRETYTEDTISIYERLNAPQWLIEQLRAAIL